MPTYSSFSPETRVNTTTASGQFEPSVAGLSGGGYVVTWVSANQDGAGYGVYGQRYDASGAKVGGETLVNTTTASDQDEPSVAGLSAGGYVVTWTSYNQDGSSAGVYGQRYDALGVKLGGETLINTTTAGYQYEPTAAGLSGGGYVITWASANQDGSGWGIYGQRYDAAGAKLGGETLINTTITNHQLMPGVAGVSGGGYVVTWVSDGQDGSRYGVYAQCYDASGGKVGSEALVNTITANDQSQPSVTALSGGGYMVTWGSDGQDGSGSGIYGQRYDAAGAKVGGETLINTTIANDQHQPNVAGLSGGGYVVTWMSVNQDGSDTGIYQRVFTSNSNGPPVAMADSAAATEDGATVVIPILANDTDPDAADTKTLASVNTVGTIGQVTANPDGTVTYNPGAAFQELSAGATATDSFAYTMQDSAGVQSAATVSVTVTGVNDAPTGAASAALPTGAENTPYDVSKASLLAGFSDVDAGDILDVTGLAADQGMVSVNPDGSFRITPGANDSGTVTLTYTVTDGHGGTIAASRSFTLADAFGTDGPDSFSGSEGADTFSGLGGGDTVTGWGGNDLLAGGDGSDFLNGVDGNDTLQGGANTDLLRGGVGDDLLEGGSNPPVVADLHGTVGGDFAAYDDATGGVTVSLAVSGPQAVGGGLGIDTLVDIENLIGSFFDDQLTGSNTDNYLAGYTGNDTLSGGGGRNLLEGGTGDDRLVGGAGFDSVVYVTATSGVTVDLNLTGAQAVGGGLGIDTLVDIEGVYSSAFADTLVGNDQDNWLEGQAGADSFSSGAGADVLIGGAGIDTMRGGEGQDSLIGNDDSDVDELYGEGGADTLVGGDGDLLHGGDGDDHLQGGAGFQRLLGGTGNDTIDGGDDIDSVTYIIATGGVTVSLAVAGPQAIGADQGFDVLIGVEELAGSNFADTLTGSDLRDFLNGGAGNDNLHAGLGDDQLQGGAGNDFEDGGAGNDLINGREGFDTLIGGAGNDTFNAGLDDDRIEGGDGDDLAIFSGNFSASTITYDNIGGRILVSGPDGDDVLIGVNRLQFADQTIDPVMPSVVNGGSAGADSLIGGEGKDSLSGANGADSLSGGTGADTLNGGGGHDALAGGAGDDSLGASDGNDRVEGGAGDDVIAGGRGADLFHFGLAFGRDTLIDFRAGEDDIRFEGVGVGSFSELLTHATQVGAHVLLTFDGGHSLQLNNVSLGGLSSGDFLFA